ncbi:MAG: helix-turn-helix transcriptional regulator [Bacteroidales bacterium]|nr:helix-turn-helix transcriptional regulator [Bacteroidales bacterium]
MSDNYDKILNLLYTERISQKKSQKDIAATLNTTAGSYSLIETGKQKMLLSDFLKIVEFLKVEKKVYEILLGEKMPNKEYDKLFSIITTQEATIKYLLEMLQKSKK